MLKTERQMIQMARTCEATMPQDAELLSFARAFYRKSGTRLSRHHADFFIHAVEVLDARGRHLSDEDIYRYIIGE